MGLMREYFDHLMGMACLGRMPFGANCRGRPMLFLNGNIYYFYPPNLREHWSFRSYKRIVSVRIRMRLSDQPFLMASISGRGLILLNRYGINLSRNLYR